MKKLIISFFILLPLYGINLQMSFIEKIDIEEIENTTIECIPEIDGFYFMSEQDFLDSIAYYESRKIYNIANTKLMLGKYQFSYGTLKHYSKEFGYSLKDIKQARKSIVKKDTRYVFNTEVFSPYLQEKIIRAYMRDMENIFMKKYITDHVGKTVNGIRITKAGILFASMLGYGDVRKFLREGIDSKDAYGSAISERLKLFENCENYFEFK